MTLIRVPAVDVERVEVNRRGQRTIGLRSTLCRDGARSYWLAAP